MKFETKVTPPPSRKARAYFDTMGDLVILNPHGYGAICLCRDGAILQYEAGETLPVRDEVRIFYDGDSVTITF